MKPLTQLRKRQRGAVAVMVGLSAIVLFGFMGIAIDLSYLYTRKTELQNAADAAALSGAKELDQTVAGVANAVTRAIATFNQNAANNLISGFTITIANLRVGPCPNPNDAVPLRTPSCAFIPAADVDTEAEAGGRTFLEVDTGSHTRPTFFMRVASSVSTSTSTYGYAVAGRFVTDVTPIGVCAVDPIPPATKKYVYPDSSTELLEWGFRRGVSYNVPALNPLGAEGTPYLVNPVDAPPGTCEPNHSSADFTAPFICQGNSAIIKSAGGTQVYVNTGGSYGKMEKALNSRFDLPSGGGAGGYGGGSPCELSSAPPDSNIKQYCWSSGSCGTPPTIHAPPAWMATAPIRQTVALDPLTNKPFYGLPSSLPGRPFSEYGVLWTYIHAHQADSSTPPVADLPFPATNANWQKLYNVGGLPDPLLDEAVYGAFPPAGDPLARAPYNSTDSSYFEQPSVPHRPGKANRRVLNLVILDCSTLGSGGLACATIDVKGIGRFFMQVPSDLTGGTKKIEAEFAGLIAPNPTSEIKLYR